MQTTKSPIVIAIAVLMLTLAVILFSSCRAISVQNAANGRAKCGRYLR